jgi:pimeloyl-ACP methyl ester carboxylesterase
MMETALRFGPDSNLVGVWTGAPSWQPGSDVPAVLWLNAGFVHHVGPFAWYTTMARRLAVTGVPSLRFDLSGVGDSTPRSDGAWSLERAVADVRAAMDWAEESKNAKRFVLVGICSGAVLAHHAAVRDRRVAGAVFLDGYGYKTAGYYLRSYGPKLMRWRSWRTLAIRFAGKMTGRIPANRALDDLAESALFDFPPRRQAEDALAALAARGVRGLFIYTADQAPIYFNHQRQFWEMFAGLRRFEKNFEAEFWGQADHLFSAHEQRQMLFERIETWLRGFAGKPGISKAQYTPSAT